MTNPVIANSKPFAGPFEQAAEPLDPEVLKIIGEVATSSNVLKSYGLPPREIEPRQFARQP